MRIDNIQGQKIHELYRKQNNLLQVNKQKKVTGDSMDISNKGRQIKELADKLEADPAVRTEKVNQLKAEIARGNYHVDTAKLADKMLEDIQLQRGDTQ